MSKIQFKIMCSLTLLVIIVVGSIGILAEQGLRGRMTTNVRIDLERQARLVAQLVENIGIESANIERLRQVTRAAALSTNARITLIDSAGHVLDDSEVPAAEIAGLSNHADRPEVIDAVCLGVGYGTRRSDTLKRTLLYVALRVPDQEGNGDY